MWRRPPSPLTANSWSRAMKQLPTALAILLVCSACAPSPRPTRAIGGDTLGLEKPRLPPGVRLDPAGTRYPAGRALSPDASRLFVAENVAASLTLIALGGKRILQRLPTGHLPYAVAAAPDGRIYVSNWGEETVSVFRDSAGTLYD